MDVKKAWPWFLAGWLLLAGAGGWIFWSKGGAFRGLETLPVESYQQAPASLRGNLYRLDGQIHSLLAWDEGTGRLFAIQPNDGPHRLPVFVPESIDASIHAGQRYRMRVSVRQDGLLHVESMAKY